MTIQLVGNPLSTCTRRVALVFKELGLDYKLVPIDFAKGEHKAPAFLEHQPFGQVPYIVDEDNGNFELFESRAIARYLVLKYGPNSGLVPQDINKLAKFEQAASIETSNFDIYASTIAYEKIFGPLRGIATNEALVQKYAETLDSKLDAYEKILSKSKYLAGDEITLADLFHLPYGSTIAQVGFADLLVNNKRPNLARWWNDITSRPSWQAVKDKA